MDKLIGKVDELYPDAPGAILELLRGCTLIEDDIGCSRSRVFQVKRELQSFYLKTHPITGAISYAHEIEVLEWLKGKLPVPEVISFIRDDKLEYLLLSEVPGVHAEGMMESMPPEVLIPLLASGLRTIHAIDIDDCPFDERVATKLINARFNLEHNLVDESDFDEERIGLKGWHILANLEANPPSETDLVFNHGDYCFPNILIHHGKISGFIDLDRAGISDKYNDLAIATRSVRQNIDAAYEGLFLAAYGIDQIDQEKIAYYRMMDELF